MNKMMLSTLAFTSFTAIAQSTNPSPYCDATFDDMDGFPVADAISHVEIGTLNNNSGGQYAAPHYVFYNNLQIPPLQKGNSYPLALSFEVHGGCGYGVWIDYNHNNQFETTEKVAGNAAGQLLDISDNTTVNTTITIPANAVSGNTRMRVRIVEDDMYNMQNDFVTAPCNSGTTAEEIMDWGETEDYMVNITGNTADIEQLIATVSFTMNETVLAVTGTEIAELKLYATNGEEVRSAQTAQLNVSGLNHGIYLLKVVTADGLILDYTISR